MSDSILSSAARLLRHQGAHLEAFSLGLDDETAWGLMIHLLAARPELLKRMTKRLHEGLARARAQRGAAEAPGYRERRDQRRAAGLARPGSCLDMERFGDWGDDNCACCQTWGATSLLDICPCRCSVCEEVANHLAACKRCPGDPCSMYMAERLGLVAPRGAP